MNFIPKIPLILEIAVAIVLIIKRRIEDLMIIR